MAKKKFNTKKLVIIFILLLAVVVTLHLVESSKGERTFKEILVQVDTSKVSSITIFPKNNEPEINILNNNGSWKFSTQGKTYSADEGVIGDMLKELPSIKPERVASTTKKSWKKYEVDDSAGVRVIVKEEGDITADFIIGKFSYKASKDPRQRQGKLTSYLRLKEEEKVFATNGFLNMVFNKSVEALRNKILIKLNKENITQLTFTNNGSSYILNKNNGEWLAGGVIADSIKVEEYLGSISYLSNQDLIDGMEGINTQPHSNLLKIEGNNMTPVEIKAIPADSINEYFILSSMNKEACFSSKKANLFEMIFVDALHFMSTIEELSVQ